MYDCDGNLISVSRFQQRRQAKGLSLDKRDTSEIFRVPLNSYIQVNGRLMVCLFIELENGLNEHDLIEFDGG